MAEISDIAHIVEMAEIEKVTKMAKFPEMAALAKMTVLTIRDRKNIFWQAAKYFLVKLAANFFSQISCFKISCLLEE